MANLEIVAVLLVVQKVVQWNIQRQTQKEVVPADYLFDRYSICMCMVGIENIPALIKTAITF